MRLRALWTPWSQWKKYHDRYLHAVTYRTRSRKLYAGRVLLATLVESDVPRYGKGQRCFMYAATPTRLVTKGTTPFRTVRAFMREHVL